MVTLKPLFPRKKYLGLNEDFMTALLSFMVHKSMFLGCRSISIDNFIAVVRRLAWVSSSFTSCTSFVMQLHDNFHPWNVFSASIALCNTFRWKHKYTALQNCGCALPTSLFSWYRCICVILMSYYQLTTCHHACAASILTFVQNIK